MLLQLTVGQTCPVTVTPVDANKNPSKVQGAPTWTTTVNGLVTIALAADGLSGNVTGMVAGTLKINVSGDADMGAGTKIITSALDVEVLAAQAVGFQFTVGTPIDPVEPPSGDNPRRQVGPLDVGAYEYIPQDI